MNKDLFFYSNFCEHCKDVINIITKKNMRELFMFVCVDNNKFRLPPCVTHVPTIITKQKDVLTDRHVIMYIEKMTAATQVADISPWMSNGYSSQYTWLTDNGYDDGRMSDVNNVGQQPYVMLGAEQHIFAPKEPENGNKSNKFDDNMYEKYINSRNADDDMLKRQMNANRF